MIRICIGFFGFIRNLINYKVFCDFKDILPDDAIIDIFITCPNKINEYDTETIDINSEIIKNIKTSFGDCNVYIDIYEYDPLIFIKKSRILGLPDYTTFPTYRVLSQQYSISRLSKNIRDFSIDYNAVILTRFDILPGILSLGNLLEEIKENTIHIWRRSPYSNDSHAEDRIIISSMAGVKALCDLYDNKQSADIYQEIVPEIMLGKYLNIITNITKLPQEGIILNLSPSIHVKYSENAKNYLNNILQNLLPPSS